MSNYQQEEIVEIIENIMKLVKNAQERERRAIEKEKSEQKIKESKDKITDQNFSLENKENNNHNTNRVISEDMGREYLEGYFEQLKDKDKYELRNSSMLDNVLTMKYDHKDDKGYTQKSISLDLTNGKGKEIDLGVEDVKGNWQRTSAITNEFDLEILEKINNKESEINRENSGSVEMKNNKEDKYERFIQELTKSETFNKFLKRYGDHIAENVRKQTLKELETENKNVLQKLKGKTTDKLMNAITNSKEAFKKTLGIYAINRVAKETKVSLNRLNSIEKNGNLSEEQMKRVQNIKNTLNNSIKELNTVVEQYNSKDNTKQQITEKREEKVMVEEETLSL